MSALFTTPLIAILHPRSRRSTRVIHCLYTQMVPVIRPRLSAKRLRADTRPKAQGTERRASPCEHHGDLDGFPPLLHLTSTGGGGGSTQSLPPTPILLPTPSPLVKSEQSKHAKNIVHDGQVTPQEKEAIDVQCKHMKMTLSCVKCSLVALLGCTDMKKLRIVSIGW